MVFSGGINKFLNQNLLVKYILYVIVVYNIYNLLYLNTNGNHALNIKDPASNNFTFCYVSSSISVPGNIYDYLKRRSYNENLGFGIVLNA